MTRDDDRQDESKRIIDRVEREAGGDAFSSFLGRTARRARSHIEATDVDPNDRIELWGTRIGRLLGGAIMVLLFGWLALYLLRG